MRKISEVSRIAGVSRRALQYYDDEGLLVVERSEYNHRLYDDDSMDKIWQILLYKEMGFELEEIKQLLSVPAAEREEYLDLRMREIGNEIEKLRSQAGLIFMVLIHGIPHPPEENKGMTYVESIRALRKNIRENIKENM